MAEGSRRFHSVVWGLLQICLLMRCSMEFHKGAYAVPGL